jgi:hypothetical protein
MEIPEDVVEWVNTHFNDGEKVRALALLSTAEVHTGEQATPRLLRCAVTSSQGVLGRLEESIRRLRVDWRDVIMAAEYRLGGRNFDGSSSYQRIYDFNRPIEEASVADDE